MSAFAPFSPFFGVHSAYPSATFSPASIEAFGYENAWLPDLAASAPQIPMASFAYPPLNTSVAIKSSTSRQAHYREGTALEGQWIASAPIAGPSFTPPSSSSLPGFGFAPSPLFLPSQYPGPAQNGVFAPFSAPPSPSSMSAPALQPIIPVNACPWRATGGLSFGLSALYPSSMPPLWPELALPLAPLGYYGYGPHGYAPPALSPYPLPTQPNLYPFLLPFGPIW